MTSSYMATGQRVDSETGLMYYKNRYYSQDMGRFMTRDLAGFLAGMSQYEYLGSRVASSFTDPMGTDQCCPIKWDYPVPDPPKKGVPTVADGKLNSFSHFAMEATFKDDPKDPKDPKDCGTGGGDDGPCRCYCCEYHQYISGTVKVNGKAQKAIGIVPLDPIQSTEDGITIRKPPAPDKFRPYGHRKEGWENIEGDTYTPGARGTGCIYHGHDEPGWHGHTPSTDIVEAHLFFAGYIQDVCTGKAKLETLKFWSVDIDPPKK